MVENFQDTAVMCMTMVITKRRVGLQIVAFSSIYSYPCCRLDTFARCPCVKELSWSTTPF